MGSLALELASVISLLRGEVGGGNRSPLEACRVANLFTSYPCHTGKRWGWPLRASDLHTGNMAPHKPRNPPTHITHTFVSHNWRIARDHWCWDVEIFSLLQSLNLLFFKKITLYFALFQTVAYIYIFLIGGNYFRGFIYFLKNLFHLLKLLPP